MEEEIDLREYVDVIVKRWKLVLGIPFLAVLVAALVSFLLLPPVYEAVATCVATNPKYQMQFDPRIQSVSELQVPAKAYAALAKNANLEKQVIAALDTTLAPQERRIEVLDDMLSASQGGDPSVILLQVRSTDPQKAATIANTWANLYRQQINELYGRSADEQSNIEAQLKTAEQNLKVAEEALITFQQRSQITTLNERIKARAQALANYLTAREDLNLIIQDAQSLKEQLQSQGATSATMANSLSTLFLEIDSLNSRARLPVQLQIPFEQSIVSNTSVSQQVQYLDNFMATLRNKQQAIAGAAEEIPPEMLKLQGQLQQEQTELDRLTRARDVAKETWLSLSRKADEVRIAAQVDKDEVRIVSLAEVPAQPVAPKKAMNIAIAGVLGLMVGVFGAFVMEYFAGRVTRDSDTRK